MVKQRKFSFYKFFLARKGDIFDLFHNDVCTMNAKNLGNVLHCITFIDDHCRKVWAFPIKTKYQVLDVFKVLHVKVERKTVRHFKICCK